MSDLILPKGWCFATIEDISVKGEQRKPEVSDSFLYVDIGSIDRELKTIQKPQQLTGKNAPSRARGCK